MTFAIDANGIVNVSAKDLGTGKQQEITIQGSSNMTREEIDRAVREAQQYAQEDNRSREEAMAKDTLERALYQAETGKNNAARSRRRNWMRRSNEARKH